MMTTVGRQETSVEAWEWPLFSLVPITFLADSMQEQARAIDRTAAPVSLSVI